MGYPQNGVIIVIAGIIPDHLILFAMLFMQRWGLLGLLSYFYQPFYQPTQLTADLALCPMLRAIRNPKSQIQNRRTRIFQGLTDMLRKTKAGFGVYVIDGMGAGLL